MLELIKQLKDRLIKVKRKKKRLAKLEWKLRSMRRLAVIIRDGEDLSSNEKDRVKERFDTLKEEAKHLEQGIRNKESVRA